MALNDPSILLDDNTGCVERAHQLPREVLPMILNGAEHFLGYAEKCRVHQMGPPTLLRCVADSHDLGWRPSREVLLIASIRPTTLDHSLCKANILYFPKGQELAGKLRSISTVSHGLAVHAGGLLIT
jgi:hypothetical protein